MGALAKNTSSVCQRMAISANAVYCVKGSVNGKHCALQKEERAGFLKGSIVLRRRMDVL